MGSDDEAMGGVLCGPYQMVTLCKYPPTYSPDDHHLGCYCAITTIFIDLFCKIIEW